MLDSVKLSIPEVLSLFGVAQCIYIILYMLFRAGRLSRAGLPLAYFSILALAFFFDLLEGRFVSMMSSRFYYLQWAAWYAGPPLSVLLIIQIAQILKTPSLRHYWVLALLPIAFLAAWAFTGSALGCENLVPCDEIRSTLTLTGLLAGAVGFFYLWLGRSVFADLEDKKTGKDRYWLVIAIIFMNITFLAATLISLGVHADHEKFALVRTVLGLGFVYLFGTSLLRIYPQAVTLNVLPRDITLIPEEIEIAKKVEKLLTEDKVYHESSYSRADMARECETSEAVLSRIINVYFKKSFPQILSEHRVADAKRMLEQTDANIKIIAEEVGFNSVASFNRVFKEISGDAPGTYRKNAKL